MTLEIDLGYHSIPSREHTQPQPHPTNPRGRMNSYANQAVGRQLSCVRIGDPLKLDCLAPCGDAHDREKNHLRATKWRRHARRSISFEKLRRKIGEHVRL